MHGQQRGRAGWVNWRRAACWLLWALGLAAVATPAAAQVRRVALVIGNGNYAVESKLANPVNDAQLMARTLKGLGFTVDERSNLPKRDMELAIARFVRESAGADSAVFYYAGHGAQPLGGGRNYLLPVDARVEGDDTLDTDGIVADRIVEQLERSASPPKLRLVILDACRNNRLAGKARSSVRGLARMTPGDDYTLIAFSTNDQDVAQDGTGANSPYAQALATHLGRANELPLRRIFELTAEDVRRATQQKQRPRTYGDLDSRARLDGTLLATARVEPVTPPVPVGPTAEQIEQQAWEAAQRANSVAALNAYLAEYPRGRYASLARVALAGMQAAPQPAPQPQRPTPAPTQTQQAGQTFKDCDVCPEMVVIPAGSFIMGSNVSNSEKPPHSVSIKSFALGKYEVTQGQWKAVMGSNPSIFSNCGDNCPVENVSWNDIQDYIRRLNQRIGKTYRLASEAEWEYAARAGSTGKWSFGESESQLQDYGWYDANSGSETEAVGQKRPNAFGLYDMHGNVWEWVEDCWHHNYSGAPEDGSAWTTACADHDRVLRGGSWFNYPAILRSADRFRLTPDFRDDVNGFRLARTVF